MPRLPDIQLPNHLKDRLVQGHPWVYRNHLPTNLRLPAGSWARVRCGNWSGYGLWDSDGPIALRIFSEREAPSARWLRERVWQAWELRSPLREGGTSAYRWLFGEGDGLPGLTVDLYGDWAVVQTYMGGTGELIAWLAEALREIASLRGILVKQRERSLEEQTSEPELRLENEELKKRRPSSHTSQFSILNSSSLLWGEPPPSDLVVEEHGLRFHADLRVGKKTGLFLDQRENRRTVEEASYGRDVLNCFAYTGAFSLYALRGGARSVESVDIGNGLAEAAAANIALNRLDARKHTFITDDCFELLDRYVETGRTFDLLILDPPSFARSRQNRHAALRAYTKLNALALRCIRPGGLLASASANPPS
jgi:23S rRNA (cytosine1962-C5)-methyltransferase